MDTYKAPEGVPPFLRGLLTTTSERHEDMVNLVRGLPEGGLTWTPAADAPAIAGIVLHILDVESYLVSLAEGTDIEWTGERGSRIHEAANEDRLIAAIEEMDQRLKAALETVTDERLSSLQPGDERPVVEALIEDLDHSAVHIGHLQLTRQLFEAAHPDVPRTYEHWR
jgi:uncharacterized damage-inducible protein DinB